MTELNKQELQAINGGGLGLGLLIGAGIIFIIGLIDGFVRPLSCSK